MVRSTTKRARVVKRVLKPVDAERDDKYFSKVIGKAFDILRILRTSAEPLSLNELTKNVGLAKSSVFRMLHTLEVSGYADRDATGRYVVSGGVRALGRERVVEDLIDAARAQMRALSREFGETVSLAVRFDNRIEVVSTLESHQQLRMGNIVGRILPPHASALGKVIAAHVSEEPRERLLRSYGVHRFTSHTITDQNDLREEFERVRERGYSTDAEESVLDGSCFGAAIFDGAKEVVGALSVSVPNKRLNEKHDAQRLIGAVREAAQHISTAFAMVSRRRV
jgi:DNA-binding IclR family transcriptional regulator